MSTDNHNKAPYYWFASSSPTLIVYLHLRLSTELKNQPNQMAGEAAAARVNGAAEAKTLAVRPPHLSMISCHGMGHLIPFTELAKRLVVQHGFTVTFLIFPSSDSKAQNALLASLPPSISTVTLPPVVVDDLPSDAAIETIMSVIVIRSVSGIRDALSELKSTTNLVAFVADLFTADTFDAAHDVGVPAYLFMPSNLLMLSLMMHLPELDASTTCEYRDIPGPLELQGCVPIPGPELLHPLQDRSNECYNWMVHHGKRYWEAEGILVNTFDAIEPGAAKVLRENKTGRPPVYPVGPLLQSGPVEGLGGNHCLEWLDRQQAGSVLFIAFGSGGTLTTEQMGELALGLEESEQRFLWVVRSPSDRVSENYIKAQIEGDPLNFLPAGFVERTKGIGLLVPSWAPQVAVLSHEATGGFLSHSGWNSTLESVVAGVPILAWPIYAEQRQNAVMLVEGAKIALRPRPAEDGVIRKEEIARVVKELMVGDEGKTARQRVAELKEAAAKALEEGGTSYKALAEVANKWKGIYSN